MSYVNTTPLYGYFLTLGCKCALFVCLVCVGYFVAKVCLVYHLRIKYDCVIQDAIPSVMGRSR